MKKVLMVILALAICMTLGLTVAADSFVSSPSRNPAPEIIEAINESEDCESTVFITPYSKRDTLSSGDRTSIEKAYKEIKNSNNLGELGKTFDNIAKNNGTTSKATAISDLFNLDDTDCAEHESHGKFRIKLSADTAKNFAGLVQFVDGEWKQIEGAKIENGVLVFETKQMGATAIVVKTGTAPGGDNQTGEQFPWVYVILMVISALGFAAAVCVYKKKKV